MSWPTFRAPTRPGRCRAARSSPPSPTKRVAHPQLDAPLDLGGVGVHRLVAAIHSGRVRPRSSNSPPRIPARKAAISAGVYTNVGPPGCRELRTAMSPLASSASSTQLPLGLLAVLLRHTNPRDCRCTCGCSRTALADARQATRSCCVLDAILVRVSGCTTRPRSLPCSAGWPPAG
jgi:hypothetical protein